MEMKKCIVEEEVREKEILGKKKKIRKLRVMLDWKGSWFLIYELV